jgi:hypothetical protein
MPRGQRGEERLADAGGNAAKIATGEIDDIATGNVVPLLR